MAANLKGDAAAYAAGITEQFVWISADGIIANRQERLKALSLQPGRGGETIREMVTRVYGDIAVTNRVRESNEGRDRQTIVHVRQGATWLRAAYISTRISPASR